MRLQNVVLSVRGLRVSDLRRVKKGLSGAWEVRWGRGMRCLELRRDDVTVRLFPTGEAIVLGAGSVEVGRRAAREFAGELVRRGLAEGRAEVEVVNMVFSAELGARVDVERAGRLGFEVKRSGGNFPALAIWVGGKRVLVFEDGYVVLPGVRDEREAQELLEKAKEVLERYQLLRPS